MQVVNILRIHLTMISSLQLLPTHQNSKGPMKRHPLLDFYFIY